MPERRHPESEKLAHVSLGDSCIKKRYRDSAALSMRDDLGLLKSESEDYDLSLHSENCGLKINKKRKRAGMM